MRIVFGTDARFDRTPDGRVWVPSGCGYGYWVRFLDVFDSVCLAARVRDVESVPEGVLRIDGDGVSCAGVSYYRGILDYARQARRVRRDAEGIAAFGDAVVLTGGVLPTIIAAHLSRIGYPYAVNVVGDPYDVFSPGSVKHVLRPMFRWWFPRQQRQTCAGAFAALYVTKEALQRRYPCPGQCAGVSDVDLPEEAFVRESRRPRDGNGEFTIMMVGTLEQLYKAPDVLIDATAKCAKQRPHIRLVMVGDGKHRPELEAQAARLGIPERVAFTGALSRERVRDQLDRADLFVLASYQEGLPRAMVEAMARGLPCIGSTVGGIPELLEPEDLVPAGDPQALARKIEEMADDADRLARASSRNLKTARQYSEAVLRPQWMSFYRCVRERMEEWLRSRSA